MRWCVDERMRDSNENILSVTADAFGGGGVAMGGARRVVWVASRVVWVFLCVCGRDGAGVRVGATVDG